MREAQQGSSPCRSSGEEAQQALGLGCLCPAFLSRNPGLGGRHRPWRGHEPGVLHAAGACMAPPSPPLRLPQTVSSALFLRRLVAGAAVRLCQGKRVDMLSFKQILESEAQGKSVREGGMGKVWICVSSESPWGESPEPNGSLASVPESISG